MKETGKAVYGFSLKCIQLISVMFLAVLWLAGGIVSCYTASIGSFDIVVRYDFLPGQLVFAVFILMGLYKAGKMIGQRKQGEKILAVAVMAWIFLCCVGLIIWGKTAPSGDSYSVYEIAVNFSWGYYDAISSPESYLTYYPQQIGLIAFYEIIFRICGALSVPVAFYHFVKVINCVLTCVIVFCQWRMIKALWDDGIIFAADTTEKFDVGRMKLIPNPSIYYLLLVPLCFPLIIYSSFMYGEIPALAMMSLAMWQVVKFWHKPGIGNGIVFILSTALSVAFRKNSLIYVIAVFIVLVTGFLYKRRWQLLLAGILALAAGVSALPCIESYYEQKAGSDLGKGVSALSYLAMGMQESDSVPGAYNGFNYNVYFKNKGNRAQITHASIEAIKDRLGFFGKNPDKALVFYTHKFLNQWTNGEYNCRQATAVDYGGRSAFLDRVYKGDLYIIFTYVADLYQFIVYGCALHFFSCIWRERKKYIWEMILFTGIITVFGGFLFHMLWEAGSRYIFPYFIILLPYAGMGIAVTGLLFQHKGKDECS